MVASGQRRNLTGSKGKLSLPSQRQRPTIAVHTKRTIASAAGEPSAYWPISLTDGNSWHPERTCDFPWGISQTILDGSWASAIHWHRTGRLGWSITTATTTTMCFSACRGFFNPARGLTERICKGFRLSVDGETLTIRGPIHNIPAHRYWQDGDTVG